MMFDASPEAILDAIADIDDVPSWSTLHRYAEVLDRHPDGRPHHVKATAEDHGHHRQGSPRISLGPGLGGVGCRRTRSSSVVSTVSTTSTRLGDQTRVRFDLIVDLAAPIPEFLIKRAKRIVLDVAIDRLRCLVTRNHG